jgi:pimeloyl-ACP methyl ester carboxylesterase
MMTMEQISESAKKKMVHAQVKVLEQCGHYLPFEVPGEFEDEVRQFWLGSEK